MNHTIHLSYPSWPRWVFGHILSTLPGALLLLTPLICSAGVYLLQESTLADIFETVLGSLAALSWVTLIGLGALIGLGLGLYQWRALQKFPSTGVEKRRISSGAGWVISSLVGGLLPGWLLVFAVIMGASNGGVSPQNVAAYVGGVAGAGLLFSGLAGAVSGSLVGACQGFILSRIWPGMPKRYALLWFVATLFGWSGSWAIYGGAAGLIFTFWETPAWLMPILIITGLVGLAGGWAWQGFLTGAVLRSIKYSTAPVSAAS